MSTKNRDNTIFLNANSNPTLNFSVNSEHILFDLYLKKINSNKINTDKINDKKHNDMAQWNEYLYLVQKENIMEHIHQQYLLFHYKMKTQLKNQKRSHAHKRKKKTFDWIEEEIQTAALEAQNQVNLHSKKKTEKNTIFPHFPPHISSKLSNLN